MCSEYDSSAGNVGAYSVVLGEPVMVPNPMITAGQAGAILDLKPHQVYRMVDLADAGGTWKTYAPGDHSR